MRYLLAAINAKYIHSNPAVYNLREYALSNTAGDTKPEILIREFTINNLLDDILDGIYSETPDMIAFSCYIWNIDYVNALIPELKKLLPDTLIWCGGPEVSYRAEEYLKDFNGIVSGVMVGEGEATFTELINTYESGNTLDLSNVKGLTYINVEGLIVDTGARENIALDAVPFVYKSNSITDFEHRIVYYESSRGCPYSCSYCLSSIDKCIRYRSLELVKDELKFLMDNKVPQVKFIDRTFNCNRERAYEIWKFIYDNDNKITNFHFEIAGDLLDDSQLSLLEGFRPGLVQFEIGVQSTNPTTIKEIHRVSNLEKLTDNVSSIKSFKNIHMHHDLIAGLPFEDINSFRKSFNEVYAMSPDQLQLGFLKMLSGSYIMDHSEDYGIVHRSYPPYEVLYTNYLSHDDILQLKRIETVVEIFYNSHQFDNSIKYIEQFFDSPFDLYSRLGDYYYMNFDTVAKHSRISRYNMLLDFYRILDINNTLNIKTKLHCVRPDGPTAIKELYLDYPKLLTLDLYLRENMKSRPNFAGDLNKYHENITKLKRKYHLSNHEHIEVFETNDTNANELIYIYFNYNKRNPLTFDAELVLL